jgi:hypothetical protein
MSCVCSASPELSSGLKMCPDPYEEEQLAKKKTLAVAALRKAMDEGVKKGWFYATIDENGEPSYGLTEEGKRAMQRGELG